MLEQLSIMLICVLLCLLPNKEFRIRRKSNKNVVTIVERNNLRTWYILPLCFLIITVFYAIRYDYGFDYWSYYERFSTGWTQRQFESGSSETLFYLFMNSFDLYFNFIIAHTLILMATLFYMTRKYCDFRYYALFFFVFMAFSEMSSNMISALRTTMAACILWIGLDLFYVNKKKWLPFIGVVIFAFFFHTSAIVFLVLPIMHFFVMKVRPRTMFIILCLLLFFRLSIANEIFTWMGTNIPFLQTYEHVVEEKDVKYNFNSIIYFSCILFPSYIVCQHKKLFVEKGCPGVYVLAMFFLFIFLSGLNFDGRFSIYFMIFFMYSLCMVLPRIGVMSKAAAIIPLIVFVLDNVYMSYRVLTSSEYLFEESTTLFYKTIFETTPM